MWVKVGPDVPLFWFNLGPLTNHLCGCFQALDLLLDKMRGAGFDFSCVRALSGSGQVRRPLATFTDSTHSVFAANSL